MYNPSAKAPSSDRKYIFFSRNQLTFPFFFSLFIAFARICCRCGQTYRLNQDGEYIQKEQCIHHWGRTVTQRVAGQIEKTYSCCSSKTNSVGCAIAPCHVHEADESQLLAGYVKTQPLKKPLPANESYGIYALDCEMVFELNF